MGRLTGDDREAKVKGFFGLRVILFALALGAGTITLAYFSKRVLPEPLSNLELALPQLSAMVSEGLAAMRRASWYRPSVVWHHDRQRCLLSGDRHERLRTAPSRSLRGEMVGEHRW
jgi:hypothetical protein